MRGSVVLECDPSEGLRDKRYVTVVVRLLLDKDGTLVHGKVADVDGRPGRPFDSWQGLTPAVRAALPGSHDDA
jgi:hypothetical protein